MADGIKIDARVTAGLHPDNVRKLDGYDDETALVCAATLDAFDAAYRGVGSVFDARAAASQDPTLNEAAVAIATQDVADRVFTRVAEKFDSATAFLKKNIAILESEMTKPIEAQASYQISQEIRAHVAKLAPGERMQFVQRAINGGDHRSATAVLGAPSYLSGLGDDMHAVLVRMYHEKHNRGAAVRIKAMKGALELCEKRSGLIFSELEKAVGMPAHRVKELKDRKAHADRLLKSA